MCQLNRAAQKGPMPSRWRWSGHDRSMPWRSQPIPGGHPSSSKGSTRTLTNPTCSAARTALRWRRRGYAAATATDATAQDAAGTAKGCWSGSRATWRSTLATRPNGRTCSACPAQR
jgi:hypothetical protein